MLSWIKKQLPNPPNPLCSKHQEKRRRQRGKGNEKKQKGGRKEQEQDTGLSVLNIAIKTYYNTYIVLSLARVNFLVQVHFFNSIKVIYYTKYYIQN